MRRLFARIVGPAFHAAVDRFDPSVDLSEHGDFVADLVRRGRLAPGVDAPIANAIGARAATALDLPAPRWQPTRADAEPVERTTERAEGDEGLRQLALLVEDAHPSVDVGLSPEPIEDWETTPHAARRRARQILERASKPTRLAPDLHAAIESLVDGLGARRWFLLKRGTIYGSADFLRAMLRLLASDPEAEGNGPLRVYCLEVLERLLRHLEVKREDALAFSADSLPPDADPALERVRFTLALLAAARLFGDLRYLNTALKTNDWHLDRLRKDSGSPLAIDAVRLHYMAAFSDQEAQMREVFG